MDSTSPKRGSFTISIADIAVHVSSPLSPAELGVEDRLGPFLMAPERPVAQVLLRWEGCAGLPVPPGELIYDPGSIWRMFRSGQQYFAALYYGENSAQGILSADARWDNLTLTEQVPVGRAYQSLLGVGAAELLFRTKILFTGGLILHASGIEDNGRGLLFVGHSGAGKSTQAGLWSQVAGVTPMSDDRIAVRVNHASGAMCYSTPWAGTPDLARVHQAPLSAIILLEQAAHNEIQRLSAAAASSTLLACAFLPYWDPILMKRALANVNSILAHVPVYLLRCRPEMDTIPLVRSML